MFVARAAGSYAPLLRFSCFWQAEFATVSGSAIFQSTSAAAFHFALQFSVSRDGPCEMIFWHYTRPA
jgi:hypothetical protein